MDMTGPMIEAIELRRSFSVQHGEIFGLLGPNGAGKTTTIRMLSGQIDPSGGRATVADCDVVKDRARLKERIGVVFEEQNLYERLSATNNLRFSCWLYNLPESRINEALDLVHLRDRAKDPVRTFSNGMKQRLMIARAIANPQPPVTITTAMINPPSTTNKGVLLGQIYTPLVLLLSLTVGTSFIPLLLLEEGEKKTLRMLLVTPASFEEILIGKLLVVLFFQIVITCVVLAIQGGFSGSIPLVLLSVVIGARFSLSLGLFFGSVFSTVSAAGAVAGIVAVIYIVGGMFVGQLCQTLGNGPVLQIARLLPTYYLADGVVNASQNLGSWGSHLFDIGVILGSTIILLVVSAWALRRQSAVLATI